MPRKIKRARRRKGTGTIEWRKDGTAEVRWVENGNRRSQVVAEDIAEEHLDGIIKRIRQGMSGVVALHKEYRCVDDYAVRYFEKRVADNNEGDFGVYKNHLRPIIGHLAPGAIKPGFVRDDIILRKVREGYEGTYVKNMCSIASTMFSHMCEDRLIEYNPFRQLSRATKAHFESSYDPKTAPWLEKPDWIAKLIKCLEPPYRYAFAVGVMAGLRPGEVRGLHWENVRWDLKFIEVKQQVSLLTNELEPCKDDDSRKVPLLPALHTLLREWWELSGRPKTGLAFPSSRGDSSIKRVWLEDYLRSHPAGDLPSLRQLHELVEKRFGSRLGTNVVTQMRIRIRQERAGVEGLPAVAPARKTRFMGYGTWLDKWHEALKELGLPDMRLYDGTRHTFGTWWIVTGGSRDRLRELLGHTDLSTTETYIKRAEELQQETHTSLFGQAVEDIEKGIADKRLGLLYRLEGRAAPPPRHDHEDLEDAG